jgi:hypothetical protein
MILWSVARASGFIAFAAYTFVIAWGMLIAARMARPAAPAVAAHRFLSMLGLVAIATHVTALLLDHFAKIDLPMLVGIGARPSVIVGVVAMWLCLALPLSFRLRKAKWISQRVWRWFHWTGYIVWVASLVHGMTSGSDTGSPFAIAAYAGAAGVVAVAGTYRLGAVKGRRPTAAAAR